jgi:hypothetical protein
MLPNNILDNQNYHHQPKLHVLHRHPLVQGVLYPAILKRGLFMAVYFSTFILDIIS